MSNILQGKRILITQADAFMGHALSEVFAECGALVIANAQPLIKPEAPPEIVDAAGPIDVLVVNLALPAPSTGAAEATDAE